MFSGGGISCGFGAVWCGVIGFCGFNRCRLVGVGLRRVLDGCVWIGFLVVILSLFGMRLVGFGVYVWFRVLGICVYCRGTFGLVFGFCGFGGCVSC